MPIHKYETVDGRDISPSSVSIGGGAAVTGGPVGDSGEWVPLLSYKPSQTAITTTSTTWTRVESNTQSSFVPYNTLSDITNVGEIGLGWSGYVRNNTAAETVDVACGYNFTRLTTTTESMTGDSAEGLESSIESIEGMTEGRTNMYMRVSAGTGTIEPNLTITVWGKIA